MKVIDLTGYSKVKDIPKDIREFLRRVFEAIRAVASDVDGTMVDGIEPLHEQWWLHATLAHARDWMKAQRFRGPKIAERMRTIQPLVEAHLKRVFQQGHFDELIPGLQRVLTQQQLLRREQRVLDQLDRDLSERRLEFVRASLDAGDFRLMPGTADLFAEIRRRKRRIGIYTNSGEATSRAICEALFTVEVYEYLVRSEPSRNRRIHKDSPALIDPETGKLRLKPDPWGWVKLCEQMDVAPSVTAIFEDRLNVVKRALSEHPFAMAVVVIAENHHQVPFELRLREAKESLSDWNGAPIILVKDMTLLAHFVRYSKPDPSRRPRKKN